MRQNRGAYGLPTRADSPPPVDEVLIVSCVSEIAILGRRSPFLLHRFYQTCVATKRKGAGLHGSTWETADEQCTDHPGGCDSTLGGDHIAVK